VIEELEAKITRLEGEMADPDLFTKNPDKFQKLTEEHGAAIAEKDAAEERWLELEILQEELSAS